MIGSDGFGPDRIVPATFSAEKSMGTYFPYFPDIIGRLEKLMGEQDRVFVEEYIPGLRNTGLPPDYKVHVFGNEIGAVEYIEMQGAAFVCDRFVDRQWNPFGFKIETNEFGILPPRPAQLPSLLEYANRMAAAFPGYIRVDFYLTQKGFVLGEVCGTPAGGYGLSPEGDSYFGLLWRRNHDGAL